MIPIKKAINNGTWLHCQWKDHSIFYQFRIKILTFQKLDLSDVDEPEKIELFSSSSATLWMMELEVINLTKEPIVPIKGPGQLVLIDHNGLVFNIFGDYHLRCASEFAKKSKMRRLYFQKLVPKIKVNGAIPFQLPTKNMAEYYVALRKGSISEL